jgi:hypothetical protein
VLVVFQVTGHTSNLGVLEFCAGCVTLCARQRRMFSKQRKARKPVLKLRHFPGLIVVALLAFRAFLAFMLVVFLVAAQAIQRGLPEGGKVLVTGLAFDGGFGVRIAQNKLGQFVLEASLGVLPVLLAMAVTTLLTQIGFVLVVFLVAAEAFLGRFFEHAALVTLFAFDLGMFTEQGEIGLVVVKLGRLFPILFCVAFAAFLAQRLFVLVVLLVASVAVLAQFLFVQGTFMTGHTGACDVLATQDIFGVGVVVKN